ncbi:hypothetical protein [Nocardioides flavescens]|uniref:hypothetical protein n=1 Tax=Nocardioides flavescens TaxID=2691959 RepID=UPI00301DC00F
MPGTLALLPEYAGREDPVAELRAAALAAVAWLGSDVTLVGDEQGARVGASLLEVVSRQDFVLPQPPTVSTTLASARCSTSGAGGPAYLVVGNGSAKRTDKAPGAFDERAEAFDAGLGASLRAGWPEFDARLAEELWASVEGIARLGSLGDLGEAQVDYDDAPYGVQYWVMGWGA